MKLIKIGQRNTVTVKEINGRIEAFTEEITKNRGVSDTDLALANILMSIGEEKAKLVREREELVAQLPKSIQSPDFAFTADAGSEASTDLEDSDSEAFSELGPIIAKYSGKEHDTAFVEGLIRRAMLHGSRHEKNTMERREK